MIKEYFLIYLIYGFAMLNMGIFCLKGKEIKFSNLSLLKSLRYLGWFGVIHGISQWVSLITIVDLYPGYFEHFYNINQILKSLSYSLLLYFGLDLFYVKNNYKKMLIKIPIVLFFINFIGYIVLIKNYGLNYHILNTKYNIITMRYAMALTGGIVAAIALFLNAKLIETTKSIKIAKRYKQLSWVLLIYGLLEGLLVKESNFFPANIINRELFSELFNFPTLALKAIIGLVINYLLIKVIETFSWEQEEKLKKLEKHKIASEERRKLGMEIHDSIIQSLYAAGLKVEYLLINKNTDQTSHVLNTVKADLNNTIDKTREFISSTAIETIELEDLNESLVQLVNEFNENQSIKINYKCDFSPFNKGYLSPEKSTEIYYIVQEALCNVIKHSKATYVDIFLQTKYDMINVSVIDNGIGISEADLCKENHIGISSMKERAERVGGNFNVKCLKRGTMVKVIIPWEE